MPSARNALWTGQKETDRTPVIKLLFSGHRHTEGEFGRHLSPLQVHHPPFRAGQHHAASPRLPCPPPATSSPRRQPSPAARAHSASPLADLKSSSSSTAPPPLVAVSASDSPAVGSDAVSTSTNKGTGCRTSDDVNSATLVPPSSSSPPSSSACQSASGTTPMTSAPASAARLGDTPEKRLLAAEVDKITSGGDVVLRRPVSLRFELGDRRSFATEDHPATSDNRRRNTTSAASRSAPELLRLLPVSTRRREVEVDREMLMDDSDADESCQLTTGNDSSSATDRWSALSLPSLFSASLCLFARRPAGRRRGQQQAGRDVAPCRRRRCRSRRRTMMVVYSLPEGLGGRRIKCVADDGEGGSERSWRQKVGDGRCAYRKAPLGKSTAAVEAAAPKTTRSELLRGMTPPTTTGASAAAPASSGGGSGEWREASKELWSLRAMLADHDGDETSVDEPPDDDGVGAGALPPAPVTVAVATSGPASVGSGTGSSEKGDNSETTNSQGQSPDEVSTKSNETVVCKTEMKESSELLPLSGEATTTTTTAAEVGAFSTSTAATSVSTTAPGLPDDEPLRRVPSVRRQTYRNAIARRLQQQKELEKRTAACEETAAMTESTGSDVMPSSSPAAAAATAATADSSAPSTPGVVGAPSTTGLTTDTESSLSFERYLGGGSGGGGTGRTGASLPGTATSSGGYSGSVAATASSSLDTSLSFRDSITSTDSVGAASVSSFYSDCSSAGSQANHRLEQLRGDSGYRSLEAQQSLAQCCGAGAGGTSGIGSVAPAYRRLSADVIREDERESICGGGTTATTTAAVLTSSTKQLTVHLSRQNLATIEHGKAAERKRIRYKCSERQVVQDSVATADHGTGSSAIVRHLKAASIEVPPTAETAAAAASVDPSTDRIRSASFSGFASAPPVGPEMTSATDRDRLDVSAALTQRPQRHSRHQHHRHHHHRHRTQQQQQQQHQPIQKHLPFGSKSSSSFLSCLLRGATSAVGRAALSRTSPPQRDYSIDERSDALFNEFIRYDPAYDTARVCL